MKEKLTKRVIILMVVVIIVYQFVRNAFGISLWTTESPSKSLNGPTTTIKRDSESELPSISASKSRSIPAVIATKIHGNLNDIGLLKQSFCLLTVTYNDRVNHDLLVFSSLPIENLHQEEIREIVAPANITFFLDAPPLDELLETFTPLQKEEVESYCNISSYRNLTWETLCRDPSFWYPNCPLRYLWQAEWRSKHLWHHPVLKRYRYLMWWDADAIATKYWNVDPIATMARNNWTLLYERFVSRARENELPEFDDRVFRSFGKYLCSVKSGVNDSTLVDVQNILTACPPPKLRDEVYKVHGFFHIVDLNVYLSPRAVKWYDNMIGETKFSRRWDDQIAVTIPGVMLNPQGCVKMRSKGLDLDILHNRMIHGDEPSLWFQQFWRENIQHSNTTFSGKIANKCTSYIKYDGRRQ